MAWLEHSLLYGPKFCLVTSQKEFERVCKSANLPDQGEPYVRSNWHASTHWWSSGAELICIVALNMEIAKDMEPINIAALLTHEAVHVWQHAERAIGSQVCDEMEAYAIQNISHQLMTDYARRLK